MQQFVYMAIVVSFFIDRVPLMRPQVPLSIFDADDPQMSRWVDAMACHGGGGGPRVNYGLAFFRLLRSQLFMLEDYAYVRTNIRDDPDLPLPYGD